MLASHDSADSICRQLASVCSKQQSVVRVWIFFAVSLTLKVGGVLLGNLRGPLDAFGKARYAGPFDSRLRQGWC
jgi:hypothetical protein